MSIVIPFRGRAEITASENLRDFISRAKALVPFPSVTWDDNAWNITDSIKKRARGRSESWAHFSSWRDTTGNSQDKSDFLQPPFIDFAKAAFCEVHRRFRHREFGRWIYALRAMEHALLELTGSARVEDLNPAVLGRAEELLSERFSNPWAVGRNLERLVTQVINPAALTTIHIAWKSSSVWVRPTRNDTVYDDYRVASKLPEMGALVALSEIHLESKIIQDRVITSLAAIALFGPARGCEITSLPVDCERPAQAGNSTLMGLEWLPAKGADPMTRFSVSDASEDIARAAIAFFTELGQPAREAARWYADHPNKLYLPPGMEHWRGKPLSAYEAFQVLGRAHSTTRVKVAIDYQWQAVSRTGDMNRRPPGTSPKGTVALYSFESIERWVLSLLPSSFPVLDDHTGLKWHEALCVVPLHSLRGNVEVYRHIPQPISISMINHQLSSMPSGQTIFARNGKLKPDGTTWKITSHQFRHLLNTMAQTKHLPQSLIAFWSGRATAAQNAWYDHVPQEAYLEAYRVLGESGPHLEVSGPLAEKARAVGIKNSISYDDALRQELGPTLPTRYGLCRHDYSLTPCPKDKDCPNCGEFAVIKGDVRHHTAAVEQIKILEAAVANAARAVADGELGAQAWLRRHEHRLGRWKMVLAKLENPSIPNGTLITLPPPAQSYTRTDHAIQAHKAAKKAEHSKADVVVKLSDLKKARG